MKNHHHLSCHIFPAHRSCANLILPGLLLHVQHHIVVLTLPQNALSSANSLTNLTNIALLPSDPLLDFVSSDPQTKASTNQSASLLKMCFLGGCFINAEGKDTLASCIADRIPALGTICI